MAKIIGLTGGIGAGKTVVSDYLAERGYPIIDADLISREVVEPGCVGLAQLVAYFGTNILLPDGALDRRAMAKMIFNDESKRRVLNAILHPLIDREVEQRLALNEDEEQVFLVVPLLYESGIEKKCDEVWMVSVDPDIQIERIMTRDHVDRDFAERQVASQLSDQEKLSHHPLVLKNNSDLPALYKQIDSLLQVGG